VVPGLHGAPRRARYGSGEQHRDRMCMKWLDVLVAVSLFSRPEFSGVVISSILPIVHSGRRRWFRCGVSDRGMWQCWLLLWRVPSKGSTHGFRASIVGEGGRMLWTRRNSGIGDVMWCPQVADVFVSEHAIV